MGRQIFPLIHARPGTKPDETCTKAEWKNPPKEKKPHKDENEQKASCVLGVWCIKPEPNKTNFLQELITFTVGTFTIIYLIGFLSYSLLEAYQAAKVALDDLHKVCIRENFCWMVPEIITTLLVYFICSTLVCILGLNNILKHWKSSIDMFFLTALFSVDVLIMLSNHQLTTINSALIYLYLAPFVVLVFCFAFTAFIVILKKIKIKYADNLQTTDLLESLVVEPPAPASL